jgi:hypothetical protein
MVRGSIGSLKTADTVVFNATSVALHVGMVEITVGAVVLGATAVVKLQVKSLAIGSPARSLTPVVTVTVIVMAGAGAVALGSGDVGVMVAMLLAAAYVTVPGMGVVTAPTGYVR